MMYASCAFTNPYAIEVLRTKKNELVEGISNPDHLLQWLIDNSVFAPEKKMVLSYYRTRTAKNSRVLDLLVSQGERACRLFFYPCLKQIEPNLYISMRNYVSDVNGRIGDARRQLIGYLLEKDIGCVQMVHQQEKKDSPRQVTIKPKKRTHIKREEKPIPVAVESKDNHFSSLSIFESVDIGNISDFKKLFKESDVNAVNSSDESLLHIAAAHGQTEIINYLISKGAKLDVKDNKGRSPLHRAAERGHDSAVKVLLQAGANMYRVDQDGKTPLHLASQNQHIEVLRSILKEEKWHKNQHHFLHMAALKDDSDLVQMLIKNGALVDAKDERGQTALGYAVSQGFEKSVKVLLEAGANIDSHFIDLAFDANNQSLFGLLVEFSKGLSPDTMVSALFKAIRKDLQGIVAALIEKGTNINALNEIQYTPLLVACELGKAASAKVLLERGANLKDKTPNSSSALHLAVQGGASSIVKMLLYQGIDPNIAGQGNQTPLHVAANQNKRELVDMLIDAGAKVNAATKEMLTPLHIASQKGHVDVAQKLLQHKADINLKNKWSKTALHLAVETGNLAMVELLLHYNADPNAADKEKKTPLHLAALGGHLNIVEALLAKKSRFGARDMDGCTPIHYSAVGGHIETVKALLVAGKNKNINDKNTWRKTALHLVAEHGHSDLISILLSNGSAINALDNNKDTPLHCACRAGHLDCVNRLVNWSVGEKANLQATNSLNKTPLQIAETTTTENQTQIVTFLKQKMLLIK